MTTEQPTPHKVTNIRTRDEQHPDIRGDMELWFASLGDAEKFVAFAESYEMSIRAEALRNGISAHKVIPLISTISSTIEPLNENYRECGRGWMSARNDNTHRIRLAVMIMALYLHIEDGYDPYYSFCQPQLNIVQGLLTFSWGFPELK